MIGRISLAAVTLPADFVLAQGTFVRPIDWTWLQRAMGLPGRALHVAIKIWRLVGVTQSREVKLNLCRIPGTKRMAAIRGLAELEQAGLEVYPGPTDTEQLRDLSEQEIAAELG